MKLENLSYAITENATTIARYVVHFTSETLAELARRLGLDNDAAATQFINEWAGLGLGHYVLKLDPLSSVILRSPLSANDSKELFDTVNRAAFAATTDTSVWEFFFRSSHFSVHVPQRYFTSGSLDIGAELLKVIFPDVCDTSIPETHKMVETLVNHVGFQLSGRLHHNLDAPDPFIPAALVCIGKVGQGYADGASARILSNTKKLAKRLRVQYDDDQFEAIFNVPHSNYQDVANTIAYAIMRVVARSAFTLMGGVNPNTGEDQVREILDQLTEVSEKRKAQNRFDSLVTSYSPEELRRALAQLMESEGNQD